MPLSVGHAEMGMNFVTMEHRQGEALLIAYVLRRQGSQDE